MDWKDEYYPKYMRWGKDPRGEPVSADDLSGDFIGEFDKPKEE